MATGKANVAWRYPQAATLFTPLARDKEVDREELGAEAKEPVYASSVRVQVLNGTGVSGRAAAVAGRLREAGFTVVGTGNAPEAARTTAVTHPRGLDAPAEVLASRLPDVRAGEDADGTPGVVTLVIGSDLALDDVK